MIYENVLTPLSSTKFEDILGDDLLNNILYSNGITTKKEYEKKFLKTDFDIDEKLFYRFTTLLANSLKDNKKITIIGDYDVDGVCATSIMYKFLNHLGFNVDYIIPNRFTNGYGLKKGLVDECLKRGTNLIITVDNGISAGQEIEYATSVGIEVFVTDHHSVNKDVYPHKATIVINPHLYLDDTKMSDYSGAVVAYLLAKFYLESEEFKATKKYSKEKNQELIEELKELAGISVVSDVMPIWAGNRDLVKNVLNKIKNNTLKNIGLKCVLDLTSKDLTLFDSEDINFTLVPILNAPGRLENATRVVELLVTNDENYAYKNAFYCLIKNWQRKEITREALSLIDTTDIFKKNVNCIAYDDLSEGIIGLVSGKVTETTSKPSFVFTKDKDGHLKGSARSPINYNLIEGFKRIIKDYPEGEIIGFGGHSGAMGLTIRDDFVMRKIENDLSHDYQLNNTGEIVNYYLPLSIDLSDKNFLEDYYKKIECLEPFGEGFKKLVLGSKICPKSLKKESKGYYHFTVTNKIDSENTWEVKFFYFQNKDELLDKMINFNSIHRGRNNYAINVFYTPTRNKFNGKIYYKGNVQGIEKVGLVTN